MGPANSDYPREVGKSHWRPRDEVETRLRLESNQVRAESTRLERAECRWSHLPKSFNVSGRLLPIEAGTSNDMPVFLVVVPFEPTSFPPQSRASFQGSDVRILCQSRTRRILQQFIQFFHRLLDSSLWMMDISRLALSSEGSHLRTPSLFRSPQMRSFSHVLS
jgi:hypothetical protein